MPEKYFLFEVKSDIDDLDTFDDHHLMEAIEVLRLLCYIQYYGHQNRRGHETYAFKVRSCKN